MTATTTDDNDKNKDEEVREPVDLTQVHEQTTHKLETEGDSDDSDTDDDKGDEDNKGTAGDDKGSGSDDDDSGSGDDDNGGSDDGGDDNSDEEDDLPEPPVQPKKEDPAPEPDKPIELNTNPEENATGKIAVKDFDGKTWYFNNMDEVPDDFEPSSYKEWGRAVQQFTRKEDSDRQAAEDERVRKAQEANQKEIDEVTTRWTNEQNAMAKSGLLPKDAKEREEAIGDTLVYIGKKLDEGIIIESFEQAHKARLFDEGQNKKADDTKKKGETRRDKGGKVMSGGGAIPGKGKEKGTDLPPGTSLDAVHARFSGLV